MYLRLTFLAIPGCFAVIRIRLDGSRLTEPAHSDGSSLKGIQTALLEILGMIKAQSAEYRRQGERA
jgi:hypothetical protein